MATSTNQRDYDIARILADYERRISFLERRALESARPDAYQVVQGSDQSVTSSIVLANSSIVVPVEGRTLINLEVRYQSAAGGGGIRWGWATSGSLTLLGRGITAAGSGTAGSPQDTQEMYWRNWLTLGGVPVVNQFNTSATNRISEVLLVEGSGTLTFQFAQQVSTGVATIVFSDSYALVTRVAS